MTKKKEISHALLLFFSFLLLQTYGLDQYQLPHPECPAKFVCDVDARMRDFASCIDAMNCHMVVGMTTKVSSKTVALTAT